MPLEVGINGPFSPTIVDLDEDGDLELVAVAPGPQAGYSTLYVIDLGVKGIPEWATLKGNAQRTGWYRVDKPKLPISGVLELE